MGEKGDIGGRCNDCRPGTKGEKGDEGSPGFPGLQVRAIFLIKNFLKAIYYAQKQ